jgi:transposase
MPRPPRRRRPGRPSKISPDRIDRIALAIRAGNYDTVAAAFAGIDPSTYRRWKARGEADRDAGRSSRYRELVEAIEQADAEAEAFALAQIRKAADSTWTAAAWFLERKWPDRWGRRESIGIAGGGGATGDKPVVVVFGGRYRPDGQPEAGPALPDPLAPPTSRA